MTKPELTLTDVASGQESWAVRLLNTRSLFVILYGIALFVIAVRPTLDPDMWWHLRTGDYIWQQGIPRQDVFSHTVAEHVWITHEWLSQALMWLLYETGGFPALILVFALIIAVSFGLVYASSAGRPFLAAFTGLLAAFASAPTWGARPQMFNVFLLSLFVFIVEGVRHGRFRTRALWWFPLLTAVWANLHSGYLAGVALLAGYAVGDAAERVLGRRLPSKSSTRATTRPVAALALVAVGSLLAAALNPNGFELWVYPFETLSSPAMQQFIQEWHAPQLRLIIFWPFAGLLLLGVLAWAFGERPEVTDALLFLGTGAAGLISARNIPLFAVVAAPIVSRALWNLWLRWRGDGAQRRRSARPAGRALLAINFVLLVIVLLAGALWVGQTIAANEEAVAARYPVDAVDFLEAEGLKDAHGFNEYGWGGYLIWRGFSVFVDGRADVYGDDFLFFYQQAAQVQADWREPLERYDVEYVLVGRRARLATMLAEVDGWREVYSDEMARVFVRDG